MQQKHAHVAGGGRLDRRLVVLSDQIPVQIHIVEAVALNRLLEQWQGGVAGEAHRPDAALLLPAPGAIQAAPGPQGLLQPLRGVDAMDRQQVHPLQPQSLEAAAQGGLESLRIRAGLHLGLQDPLGIRNLGQQQAQLAFRTAVSVGGFDVVHPGGHRRLQDRPQIGLALGRDRLLRHIAPALLKPHATEGEHRHRQTGAAETAGGDRLHGAQGAPWSARGRVRRSRAGEGSPRG